MHIVLIGGGTGGHIFPLVAVAKKIRETDNQADFLYLGPKGDLEKKVMEENTINSKYVMSGKARRYFSFANIVDVFKIPIGIVQSLWHLLWFMPDVIFSKGGYASVPIVIVAWIYRIPVLTHESDSIPGIANRIVGKFSKRIAVSYPRAKRYFVESKTFLTGNPVREDIVMGSKESCLQKFNLTESRPIILVLGGSQGAQKINEAIANALDEILKVAQVIHQTGEKNYKTAIHQSRLAGVKEGRRGYYPVPFLELDDLKDAFAGADIVISRAGANSISEIAANKKPAILIPLAMAANNHQKMNAYALSEEGGAIVLEESNLGRHILLQKINKIFQDEDLRKNLSNNIAKFYHSDASEKIAKGLLELVN